MSARTWFAALSLAVVVGLPAAAEAQRRDPPRSDEDRERLEERLRARVAEIIRERLGLDPEQEDRLSEIFKEAERDRRALAASERQARRDVQALVEASAPEEARARALLDTLLALEERESELYRREQERLLEVITPYQLLQLHQIRIELGRRIRALRGRGSGGDSVHGGPDGRRGGAADPHAGHGDAHSEPSVPGGRLGWTVPDSVRGSGPGAERSPGDGGPSGAG